MQWDRQKGFESDGGKKTFSYEIFELFKCLLIQIIEALS